MTYKTPKNCLHWLALSLLAVGIPAWAANTLEQVKVNAGQNDTQVIRAEFKDTVADAPVVFTTSEPRRIIIDFAKTDTPLGRHVETVGAGTVQDVQIIQAGERTRMVVNLQAAAEHEIKTEGNKVFVTVKGLRAGATAPATSFVEAGPKRSHSIRDIDFRRGKAGEARIIVSLSDTGTGIDIKQQGKAIQVDFLNTSLPQALARRLDVTDFATPAHSIETLPLNGNTRMLITPSGKVSHSAYQSGNQFIIEIASLENGITATKPGQYSGEKITLDFYNVEVKDLLKVLADFTGLNIVTSDKVGGTTSLRLKDIPWDQALDIILSTTGLDKRVLGDKVIWVATRDELADKDKRDLENRQKIAELENLQTEAIRLNYLRADEAQAIISGQSVSAAQAGETVTCSPAAAGVSAAPAQTAAAAQGGAQGEGLGQRILSKRGSATYELKTNTLFVHDTAAKIDEIKAVLAKIDVAARQVMIEARIVLADDKFSRNLGARLMLRRYSSLNGGGIALGGQLGKGATVDLTKTPPQTTDYGSDVIGMLNTGSIAPASVPNVNLPFSTEVQPPSTLGLGIVNAAATTLLGLEIQALETDGRGKVVSNPRVVTENQKPAVILQGTQIPYQTVSQNGTKTEFKNAFLCLLVSPQVLNNDDVILNVEVTKDAPGDLVPGGVQINTKRVKTQIRVKNGETAVLGGIFEQETNNNVNKVPLLGDIPILGHLFRSDAKRDNKTELMIFLTPRLAPEGLVLTQ